MFLDFSLYGSLEALDGVKILSRGAPTISTPGKPNSENFFPRLVGRLFSLKVGCSLAALPPAAFFSKKIVFFL